MPGPMKAVKRPKNTKVAAQKFLKSLGKWKVALLVIVVLSAVATVLTIFGPKLLGNMTTLATESLIREGKIDWGPIIQVATLLIGLYLLSAVISYIQGFVLAIVSSRYTKGLREQILAKISKLPMAYYDKVQIGDTLSRMTNDVDTVAISLQQSLTEIITSLTMVVGILVMMLSISWELSVIALVAVPVSLGVIGTIMKRAQKYFRKQRTTLGVLNSKIEEDYTGQLLIKVNNHGSKSLEEFKKVNERLYETSWKSQFYGSLAFPLVHIFTNVSYVAICVVGGYKAINGQISIGDVQAFIQYVNQFNRPITEVAQITATIQQTLAAAERIFDFLEQPEEQERELGVSTGTTNKDRRTVRMRDEGRMMAGKKVLSSTVKGAVGFHNVNFSYDKVKPVIKEFSAKIKPGMRVAIVGPTGAGKTTIVNLLMRFYDPDSGYITIDGVPTRELSRGEVREKFGMVLQDTWLFSGTVYDNLRYGKTDATEEEVRRAAKVAGVDHFIESLPHGYKTMIDEDSDNISAGEKQLLTIARAMVANPPMMILDEATSNVDTRTEQLIQDAFEKLTNGRTSFVIAHRLSTIRDADLILVMKEGNIVEQGVHEELLAAGGFYAELYNSQFDT